MTSWMYPWPSFRMQITQSVSGRQYSFWELFMFCLALMEQFAGNDELTVSVYIEAFQCWAIWMAIPAPSASQELSFVHFLSVPVWRAWSLSWHTCQPLHRTSGEASKTDTAIKSWKKDLAVGACFLLRDKFVYLDCQNITVGGAVGTFLCLSNNISSSI